ncbi:MAG: hypothetical protein MH252_05090 [Thermosynechococcaceae cyanobacterium MS004]|nr:hypothetical protein [Thermosynechococcaceae cyanobacterium MS004]
MTFDNGMIGEWNNLRNPRDRKGDRDRYSVLNTRYFGSAVLHRLGVGFVPQPKRPIEEGVFSLDMRP